MFQSNCILHADCLISCNVINTTDNLFKFYVILQEATKLYTIHKPHCSILRTIIYGSTVIKEI